MGTKAQSRGHSPGDALFTRVQQRVLALLFGQPGRRFQSAELIRLAKGGTGAVHRQLSRLANAGLVTVTRSGNQKHYQARRDSAVFEELHGLVVKTVAVVEPLGRALEPLADDIDAAFVYGSVAAGTDSVKSDIDLMILSATLGHADVFSALEQAERELGRSVNPTLMTPGKWQNTQGRRGTFASRVAGGPRLPVLGSTASLPEPSVVPRRAR